MTPYVVLVVEDDAAIRRGLVDALGFAGYEVLECDNGGDVLNIVEGTTPDLVLLDVMLPVKDGFEVLEQLRATSPSLPVIMVTARGAEEDRVRGLTRGADDYVIKPFSAREVLARVQAVLRRSPERATEAHTLVSEGLRIDLERRELIRDGSRTDTLTEREAAILRYLFANRDRVIDRRELLQRVWRYDPSGIETRTVDMHIARLRDKLESDSSAPRIIITVRGKGYQLSDAVEPEAS
jgi:DNA-binding response OmpR family regulator